MIPGKEKRGAERGGCLIPCPGVSPLPQEMQGKALPGRRTQSRPCKAVPGADSRRAAAAGAPGAEGVSEGGSLALAPRVPQFGRRRSSNRF